MSFQLSAVSEKLKADSLCIMKRLLVALVIALAAHAAVNERPLQVKGLRALHNSGQTFLTFQEIDPPLAGEVKYYVYRSRDKIKDVSRLARLAAVSQDSAINIRASNRRVENRQVRLRIAGGEEVPEGRGLFVYTVPENGAFYYAVTAVVDGVENRSLAEGENSLASPVEEEVAWPEPVLQGSAVAQDGILTPYYVHYVNANRTPLLPPMSNSFDTKDIHLISCKKT